MLSQRDLDKYRNLDGKRSRFFLLNVDVHDHSTLLANGDPHDIGAFYRLSAKFFELAVELNHGLAAPWQGDGGFAIFDASENGAFQNVWNAASDFLVPYQNQILRNLLNQVNPTVRNEWIKNYPKYYCLIDSIDFVFDFNSAGNWCGYGLSRSLKTFKDMAKPNALAITKAAYSSCGDPNFWKGKGLKSPHKEEVYHTTSLGGDLIISNPHYRERIYKQQADNIAARNTLTEFIIENGFTPKQFLITVLHCLAKVFFERDDVKEKGFRASVWRKRGNHLEFVWGYPRPDCFEMSKLKGVKSQFRLGEGCAGKVWETGKPILSADMKKETAFMRKHENHSDASAAFYPILPKERWKMTNYSPNQLIGVLCLGVTNKSGFRFKQEDKDIIETYVTPFALNLGLALKLLEKEEKEARDVNGTPNAFQRSSSKKQTATIKVTKK